MSRSRSARRARVGSSKNITPNWPATTSNRPWSILSRLHVRLDEAHVGACRRPRARARASSSSPAEMSKSDRFALRAHRGGEREGERPRTAADVTDPPSRPGGDRLQQVGVTAPVNASRLGHVADPDRVVPSLVLRLVVHRAKVSGPLRSSPCESAWSSSRAIGGARRAGSGSGPTAPASPPAGPTTTCGGAGCPTVPGTPPSRSWPPPPGSRRACGSAPWWRRPTSAIP